MFGTYGTLRQHFRNTLDFWKRSSFQNMWWALTAIWKPSNRHGCRVSGIMRVAGQTSPLRRQSSVLTVEALLFLESVLENQQIAGVDRYAVGVTLFATYSRARFGDLRSIASILIDEVPPNKEENIGFLEMHSASHKMRATGNRLGSHLPLVAPLEGFGADILGKNIHQGWQGSGSGHEQLASILPTVTCA